MNDGVRWQAQQHLPVGFGIEPAQRHLVLLIAALALWMQEAKPIRMEMEWRGDGVAWRRTGGVIGGLLDW
jgi:hypothetical protein